MTEFVIGWDLSSTRLAAVVVDLDGEYVAHWFRSWKTTRDVSLNDVYCEVTSWLDSGLPADHCYVEEPLVTNRNPRVTIQQAYINAVVRLAVERAGGHPRLISVTAWKKSVVGAGNAKKEQVAGWVKRERPRVAAVFGSNQDLYDAFCLARHGAETRRKARAVDARGTMSGDDQPLLLVRRRKERAGTRGQNRKGESHL